MFSSTMQITLSEALNFFCLSDDFHPDQLKQIYRRLSLAWHPDKHNGDVGFVRRFQLLNALNSALSKWKTSGKFEEFWFNISDLNMSFGVQGTSTSFHPKKYPQDRINDGKYPRSGFPLFDKALREREQWEKWMRQLRKEAELLAKDDPSLQWYNRSATKNMNIYPHWHKYVSDKTKTKVSSRKYKKESTVRTMKEFARKHNKLIEKLKLKKNPVSPYV